MNKKISYIRKLLGLSAKEISTFLNISTYKYNYYERSKTIPFEIIIMLSKIYDIDIEMFYDTNYDYQDLFSELVKHDILDLKKELLLTELKNNFFNDRNAVINYHNVKKVKTEIQNNIILSISNIVETSGLSLPDFARNVGIDVNELASILTKKRFANYNTLKKISNGLNVSLEDIINKNI